MGADNGLGRGGGVVALGRDLFDVADADAADVLDTPAYHTAADDDDDDDGSGSGSGRGSGSQAAPPTRRDESAVVVLDGVVGEPLRAALLDAATEPGWSHDERGAPPAPKWRRETPTSSTRRRPPRMRTRRRRGWAREALEASERAAPTRVFLARVAALYPGARSGRCPPTRWSRGRSRGAAAELAAAPCGRLARPWPTRAVPSDAGTFARHVDMLTPRRQRARRVRRTSRTRERRAQPRLAVSEATRRDAAGPPPSSAAAPCGRSRLLGHRGGAPDAGTFAARGHGPRGVGQRCRQTVRRVRAPGPSLPPMIVRRGRRRTRRRPPRTIAPVVANAAVPSDAGTFAWHVDMDPAALDPRAPFAERFGTYVNRRAGTDESDAPPRFVSALAYLSGPEPWDPSLDARRRSRSIRALERACSCVRRRGGSSSWTRT